MIRESISYLVSGRNLTTEEATTVMQEIMDGEATPGQLGAFLTALSNKGEEPQEIAGMARVMREKALHVEVEGDLVDTCGTGGDGKNSFNISTASAFVAAGAGLKVAKHGNRAAGGSCGSADVLEALGVKIDLPPEGVERCIKSVGMGFMFAPVFHPSMRFAAPIRREIGIRTVFNILGPLTNPAGAQYQLIGVAYAELGRQMAEVLRLLEVKHAIIAYGQDGFDELTLDGSTTGWEIQEGMVRPWSTSPREVGLPTVTVDAIRGGTKEENAEIMRSVFQGKPGPFRDVVILNSAAVLLVGNRVENMAEGVEQAAKVIDAGVALDKLESFISISQQVGIELEGES